jgi:hypothetical protein
MRRSLEGLARRRPRSPSRSHRAARPRRPRDATRERGVQAEVKRARSLSSASSVSQQVRRRIRASGARTGKARWSCRIPRGR